jgi:hypothetical protein
MASSYSSDLKLELMVTGEKSNLWGDITNTNLVILQQAIAGYEEISIAGGAQTTALTFSNGITSNGKNAVIKLTGTITGNQIVTIPDSIEKVYVIENGTTGAFTVQIKTVSGTGPTFTTVNKGQKFLYANGTDVVDIELGVPGGTDKQIQFNDNGAFGGITMGTVGQILSTDGTTASFTDAAAGGADWQAVKTTIFNALVGEGYFVDTSAGVITATLPASPSLGDFIAFVDYAKTFDTNNFTVGRNGKPIQGIAEDLIVDQEGAGFTLVFIDDTQGWTLQNN